MKSKHILIVALLLSASFSFSQDLSILDQEYSRKEIKQIKALDNADQKIVLDLITSELTIIEKSKVKTLPAFADSFTEEEIASAKSYADLGILPLQEVTQYFEIKNTNKVLVLSSINRREIELKSKQNIK